jgi:hypothetical protein
MPERLADALGLRLNVEFPAAPQSPLSLVNVPGMGSTIGSVRC